MDNNTDRSRIMDKIRKCLALSESANENEAASAMRQAQALMRKHGLSADDMSIFEVKEASIKIKYKAPPLWFQHLGIVISIAFGCSLFTKWHHFIFVGPSVCAEVAGYSLDVLRRQCDSAKLKFLAKEIFIGLSASTKRKLGQNFCEGWVRGVYAVVREFSETITDEQSLKHTKYLETITQKSIETKESKPEKEIHDPVRDWAIAHGQAAGQTVKLHAGVAAGEQRQRIGNTFHPEETN